MTIREFCLQKTKARELCVIRECGYIVCTAWIDHEDLFELPQKIADQEIKSDEWGELAIVTEHDDSVKIPCHYIDFW